MGKAKSARNVDKQAVKKRRLQRQKNLRVTHPKKYIVDEWVGLAEEAPSGEDYRAGIARKARERHS